MSRLSETQNPTFEMEGSFSVERTYPGSAAHAEVVVADTDCRRCGYELDTDGYCSMCGASLTQAAPEASR